MPNNIQKTASEYEILQSEKITETVNIIAKLRLNLTKEELTQQQIFNAIGKLDYIQHHHLDKKNIPDFFHRLYGIAIEVKIKGTARQIYKQCERYCGFDETEVLILCTNKSMGFPPEINGKPCYFINIGKAWL